jgi:hypothetical protein
MTSLNIHPYLNKDDLINHIYISINESNTKLVENKAIINQYNDQKKSLLQKVSTEFHGELRCCIGNYESNSNCSYFKSVIYKVNTLVIDPPLSKISDINTNIIHSKISDINTNIILDDAFIIDMNFDKNDDNNNNNNITCPVCLKKVTVFSKILKKYPMYLHFFLKYH